MKKWPNLETVGTFIVGTYLVTHIVGTYLVIFILDIFQA